MRQRGIASHESLTRLDNCIRLLDCDAITEQLARANTLPRRALQQELEKQPGVRQVKTSKSFAATEISKVHHP